MAFTAVPAALLPEGQNRVEGDGEILAGGRVLRIPGLTSGLLGNMPADTLFANLYAVAGPGQAFDAFTFAGTGLTYADAIENGPFPTVVYRGAQSFATPGTTQTLSLPEVVNRDRLIIGIWANGAAQVVTTPTGFSLLGKVETTAGELDVYERICDGSTDPAGTLPIAYTVSSSLLAYVWQIKNSHTTLPSDIVTSLQNAGGTTNDIGTLTATASAAAVNTLWLTFIGIEVDGAPTISVFPTGFTQTGETVIASATASIDAAIGYGERNLAALSLDPSAYTHIASNSGAVLIAVPPRPSGAINWDGLRVRINSTGIGFIRGQLNLIAGAGITLGLVDDAPNGEVDLTITNSGGGGGSSGWDDTLLVDAHSGATSPFVDTGQFITFSTAAATQVTGQIRSDDPFLIHVDQTFEIQAHDDIYIHGPDSILLESTGGSQVQLLSSASINLESTSSGIILNANSTVQITNGFLRFTENAASTPSMAAGQGLFWVKNTASPGNEPFFTDDANADFPIFTAISENGAAPLGNFSRINFDDSTKIDVTVLDLGGRQANVLYQIKPGSIDITDLSTSALQALRNLNPPGQDGQDGRDGDPGQPGRDGAQGLPGRDGAPGQDGQDGRDGDPGVPGPPGATGPAGSGGSGSALEGLVLDPTEVLTLTITSGTYDAITSHVDSDNTLGSTSLTGVTSSSALATAPGALDRVVVDCNIYCVAAGSFSVTSASVDVIGPLTLAISERVEFTAAQGWRVFASNGAERTGTPGPTGPAGIQGSVGPPGDQGEKGDQGDQGPPGLQGPQGIQGITGNTGATGITGQIGPPGDQGEKGDQGDQGPPGSAAAAGAGTGLQFITYGSEATLSNERVATASTSITINTSVGSQIAFELANMAANTFKGNVTGSTSAPTDNSLSTLAGDSLDYAAGVIDYVGTTSVVTLTGITGNQGTVNIATLECGGRVVVDTPIAAWMIEGFTAKANGFWFCLTADTTSFATNTGCLFHEDTTATSTNRLRCPQAQNCNGIAIQAFIYYGNSRWNVVTGNVSKLIASDGINPQNRIDVRDSSGDVSIGAGSSSNSINLVSGLGAGGVVISSGHTSITSSVGGIDLDANTRVRIASGPLHMAEISGVPTTVAGDGAFYVKNTLGTTPRFRDDENVEWLIGFGSVAVNTADVTITAATAQPIVSFTCPANVWQVGTTYCFQAYALVVHTAVTTTNPTFQLQLNGVVVCTVTAVLPANSGSVAYYINGQFTCRTTGAGGTVKGTLSIKPSTSLAALMPQQFYDDYAAVATLNTTATATIRLTGHVATVVASNSIVAHNAIITRET